MHAIWSFYESFSLAQWVYAHACRVFVIFLEYCTAITKANIFPKQKNKRN